MKIRKSSLRVMAKVHSKLTVINIARGKVDGDTENIKPDEVKTIISTFKDCLGVENLAEVSVD